jgi:hypothetical protein
MKIRNLLSVVVFCIVAAPWCAAAESQLYFSPASGSYAVNQSFPVTVQIDTAGESINAAEGTITFNAEELRVENIEITPSIFTMWFIAPTTSISGKEGTIRFSGAVPAGEEFVGTAGRVMTVQFRALRNVSSEIWFSQGAAVLAANGRGNNMLSSLRSATFSLTQGQVASAVQFANQDPLAAAPRLSSPTHPLQTGWYSAATATISVLLPSMAQRIKSGLSRSKEAFPEGSEGPLQDTLVFGGIPEGVNYALVQYTTPEGISAVGSYALNIDRTPPLITTFTEAPRADPTDPRVAFSIAATDEGSGIAWYELQINDLPPEVFETPAGGTFRPDSPLRPGEYTITAVARDAAGNTAASTTAFSVTALEAPAIERVPDAITAGEPLTLHGGTYGSVEVVASIVRDGEAPIEKRSRATDDGAFTILLFESTPAGMYSITLAALDERGASSPPSAPIEITVRQPALKLFGSIAISYLSILVPLIALLILVVIMLAWVWGRARGFHRGVLAESTDAQSKVHQAFEDTYMMIEKQIRTLERAGSTRELTREESGMLRVLERQLLMMEQAILEEIRDVSEPTRAQERAPVAMKEEGSPVYVTRL